LLKEVMCCPRCKGDLRPEAGSYQRCSCSACDAEYPIMEGVVDFQPLGGRPKGRGQRLMEYKPMVRIYESRLWRASKLFVPFMGISLDREIALIKEITHPGPAEKVLDLACGPGIYARAFAEGNPRREVFGLDLSWPMLRYAVGKAQRLGMGNITFMRGDAHWLPFRDCSLDVANCCGALHLFSDIRRVLGSLARVLRPGGRFSAAAALLRPESRFSRLKARLDGKYWGVHYFRQAELEGLFDEAGFEPTVHHAKGIWIIISGLRRA